MTEGTSERGRRRGVGGTRTRAASGLAWALWAVTVSVMALTLAIDFLYSRHEDTGVGAADVVISLLVIGSFATVGAVVSSHRPGNPIGWIFCAMGFAFVIAMVSNAYARYGLEAFSGSLPGATTAAWTGNWIWPVVLSPVGFLLLLFPSGHLPSRRWRPVAWLLGAALVGWFVSQAFMPGPMVNAGYASVPNPYGIVAFKGVLEPLGVICGVLLLIGVLASVIALLVRFRFSRGDERRQLKWLAYTGVVVILAAAVSLAAEAVAPQGDAVVIQAMQFALVASLSLVPIAVGIAILKYRLYDIDVIINRTLVYGSLTATLALVYAGSVMGLQATLRALTGQESTLAIVASTLAIAALFSPLRRRVQALVERRFYRRKYDAAKTIAAFNARLREETDLEALCGALVGVAGASVQPEHVSLWLRPKKAREGAPMD